MTPPPLTVPMERLHFAGDNIDHGGSGNSTQSHSVGQKRNRLQLSCSSCRHGKLKCDRQQPCSQCVRKGRSSQCTFPMTPWKPAVSLQNRVKHLESLVKDVMTTQGPVAHEAPSNSPAFSDGIVRSPFSQHNQEQTNEQQDPAYGQVLLTQGQVYVGATHWAAIVDDIEEVKGFLEESVEDSDRERSSHYSRYAGGPSTAACCGSSDISLLQLYKSGVIPTFNKNYRQFWLDPEGTPTIFVGLLYAFMLLATLSIVAAGEVHADTRASPREMLRAYKENCVQCLILSDYTKPTRYTLETMMIYGEAEFLMSGDDQVHCYLLMSVAVRLALRTGLHRDSSKIGTNFTPFEAEARRRMWYHIKQLDLLTSFHIGLPGMVQTIESDTLPPRNLQDEDFDEDCTELPPSRPESEMTPMSYALCKGRLSEEAGKIMVVANKLHLPPFDEVMTLDSSLRAAYNKVPPQLRLDESEIDVTDSPSTILKRFTVSVLYEKSRCMLHRKFLLKAREYPEYQYSKQAGLDASKKLIHRQALVHRAASPGGPLPLDQWFLSSFSTHRFLLAAMIIYLNVMSDIKDPYSTHQADIQASLDMLEMSRDNWEAALKLSPEAKRASLVLTGMVEKVYQALGRQRPPKDRLVLSQEKAYARRNTNDVSRLSPIIGLSNSDSPAVDASALPVVSNSATHDRGCEEGKQDFSFSHTTGSNTSSSRLATLPDLDMGVQADPFESILNVPNDFDWEMFDTQVRPQQSAVKDAWPDFNTDLGDGMNEDYIL
ncbi:Fusarisetin A cluster transcription factor fsa6 [Hyphodiscus hymeniophilus]|uniref:Fusarisetin A cluster transcription factor fsa6 n=1 Tax=Hyphodiscus hymeniophilus TaxID=353542 RepID=A0A9P6VMW8_9HELO|nr:Fusarisetin A cluster transcription factor fsa6 [Hyphodiscus hymeniophilus]